jgi:hypothetical protein
MGERHDGIPLWVHVALGVAVGLVAGGVLLYWLWAWHTSSAVVRERPTLRAPAVVPSAPAKTGSPCPPSYALGVLNGVTVCVSATGQVVEVLR